MVGAESVRLKKPLTPGAKFEYEVLDMFGRPWGHLWEEYYEQNMQRPDEEDIFNFEPATPAR